MSKHVGYEELFKVKVSFLFRGSIIDVCNEGFSSEQIRAYKLLIDCKTPYVSGRISIEGCTGDDGDEQGGYKELKL